MKQSRIVFALVSGIAATASFAAFAKDKSVNLRAQIESSYSALRQAMDHRSPSEIQDLLAPGFDSIEVDGTHSNAEQMIASVVKLPPNSESVDRHTTVVSLMLDGNIASLQQRYDRSYNRAGPDGVNHAMKLIANSSDKWLRVNGKWKLMNTTTLEMIISRDGEVVLHRKLEAAPARRQ